MGQEVESKGLDCAHLLREGRGVAGQQRNQIPPVRKPFAQQVLQARIAQIGVDQQHLLAELHKAGRQRDTGDTLAFRGDGRGEHQHLRSALGREEGEVGPDRLVGLADFRCPRQHLGAHVPGGGIGDEAKHGQAELARHILRILDRLAEHDPQIDKAHRQHEPGAKRDQHILPQLRGIGRCRDIGAVDQPDVVLAGTRCLKLLKALQERVIELPVGVDFALEDAVLDGQILLPEKPPLGVCELTAQLAFPDRCRAQGGARIRPERRLQRGDFGFLFQQRREFRTEVCAQAGDFGFLLGKVGLQAAARILRGDIPRCRRRFGGNAIGHGRGERIVERGQIGRDEGLRRSLGRVILTTGFQHQNAVAVGVADQFLFRSR